MERLDIIVFGATGYTGSFLVRELATTFKNEKITKIIIVKFSPSLFF